ncbi:hypothetical protein KJ762_13135 [bacterium]|nr:hypothetical protein [bacterium]MBU1635435.1 hypothetical protein [bacterium]
MAVQVNAMVQDANVLLNVVQKYAVQLAEFGVTPEEISAMQALVPVLIDADAAHKEQGNKLREKTGAQNALIKTAESAIRKIRNAANVVYLNDPGILKDFHIGINIPHSVAGLVTELNYIHEVAVRRLAELATRGIKEADLTVLTEISPRLQAIDSEQETIKREKVSAMAARDGALKELRRTVAKFRKIAKLCFSGSPEILNEFKKLPG